MSEMSSDRKNRVFIGGISDRIQKEDIEREFGRFGKLTNVWVAQNPPGFAFVEYDHISEAENAVESMHDREFLGSLNKIRVEHSHGGGSRNRMRRGGSSGMSSRGRPDGGYSSNGRMNRDRYGSGGGGGGGGYDNGGGYQRDNGYQRRNGGGDGYSSAGRSDGGERRRFAPSNGGGGGGYSSSSSRPQRFRSDSGSDRYSGGGGGSYRNRSRSPPSGGRSKFHGGSSRYSPDNYAHSGY